MSYIGHPDYNSSIWSKIFTSAFYLLAHLGAKKKKKKLGRVNHVFTPWGSITFFK